MANYKDGVIRDGSSVGSGKALGNIKDGVVAFPFELSRASCPLHSARVSTKGYMSC